MNDWGFAKLFPAIWRWEKPQSYDQQIIVNWLDLEVDNLAPEQMPILHDLSGWRNREIWEYVKTLDWTSE